MQFDSKHDFAPPTILLGLLLCLWRWGSFFGGIEHSLVDGLCFQGKPLNITVIQVYTPTTNAKEAEVEQFNDDLQDLLELTPKKDVLFIIGDWNAKLGRQEITRVTGLRVQNEAGQMLTEFWQENALVMANTLFQQHRRRLYTWTSTDGQYQNQIDYSICSQRWRSSIQSAKTRLRADCGSDHKLLIAKFRLNLKKVGKTNRPGVT